MASYEIFMEDEVEIGRWVFKETKKVHLALDPHSSSYNQIGIKHIIQNIGSSRHIHLANSNNVSDALCIIYGHDNRLGIGTRVIKGTTEVLWITASHSFSIIKLVSCSFSNILGHLSYSSL